MSNSSTLNFKLTKSDFSASLNVSISVAFYNSASVA